MHDFLDQLRGHLWGINRHRWAALSVAWLVCVAGWTFTYLLPDQFKSEARVYVDTQSVLKPLLRGLTVETDVVNTAAMMTRALLSKPTLKNVVMETDLHQRVRNDKEMEKLLDNLSKKIEIQEDYDQRNLFRINYTDVSPIVAKNVVETLLSNFVTDTLGAGRSDTGMAQRFLDDQIKEYEERLEKAESRLKDFKRKNVGLMPSGGVEFYQQLQTAETQYSGDLLKLRETEQRVTELRVQVDGEEPTFVFSGITRDSEQTQVMDSRIAALQEKLDGLLLRFTSEHPDVVEIENQIKELERRKLTLVPERQQSQPSVAEESPVYQQLKIALGKAEAEYAALNVRVQERQSRVRYLQKMVDTIPKVEAELARLNRDYAIVKTNYESLLNRREAAHLSREADQRTDDIQFRVIDPPQIALRPAGPPRMLFVLVILVVGIGAGVAAAMVLAQFKPRFYTSRSLTSHTGLPLLGSVSLASSAGNTVKKAFTNMVLVLVFLVLIAAAGALTSLELMEINVRHYVMKAYAEVRKT